VAYSKEYLIEKLKSLLDKYGTIQTQLIDKEPNFPNRKAYIRVFGSVEKACEAIGYYEYQKHKFDIDDAQKVLDERNGHFILLNFNGMRNKSLMQCKDCGTIDNIVPDSVLRNKTKEHFGCKVCNNKKCKNVLAMETVKDAITQLSLKEIKEQYPRKDGYGYVYEVFNLINNKRYIGSTINPYDRWKDHIWAAFAKDNPSYKYPLQSALRKYGIHNFIFHVLYIVPINNLSNKERETIIERNTFINEGWGYNQTLETECALRDGSIKPLGMLCALIDDNNNVCMKFESYHDAARILFNNAEAATQICAVCNGRRKTYRGMRFVKLERGD
jgi:hypothetical protein